MIDKLHFKAHLKDFYLNRFEYSEEYEQQGRGDYILYTPDFSSEWAKSLEEVITLEQHQAVKAVTPHLTRFVEQRFELLELGITLSAGIIPRRKSDGTFDPKNFDAEKMDKYWESIPSSYSGLAFKMHDLRGSPIEKNLHCPVYIEFHASPAKLLQGHNIFGSDDIVACKDVLVDVLLAAYPVLAQFFDFENLYISSFDITYFSRADSQANAVKFLEAIDGVSRGQTKSRSGFKGATSYFGGARSKLKKLKVYGKYQEVMNFYNKLKASLKNVDDTTAIIPFNKIKDFNLLKIYTQELLDFTLGMIRWEATIKSDWLRERGYSLHFNTFVTQFEAQKLWQDAFKDLFFLLESKTMTTTDFSEDTIRQQLRDTFVTYDKHGQPRYTNATNAFTTFMLIKTLGFQKALKMYTIETSRQANKIQTKWYTHLQMFRDIGLTDIYLQGFKEGEDSTATVIPLLILVVINAE